MSLNMPMPFVSILMTTYNREKYITDAIESVLRLTYSNWELIICDDCSTDNSLAIAKQYEEMDNRIKIYKNDVNLGDYPNRNRAASFAKGKYIKYLDSDDLIYPHGLGVMVSAMEEFTEAAFALSYSKPQDVKPYPFILMPNEAYREHFLGRGVLNTGPSGSIIRRDIFESEGGFKLKRFLGDNELWLRLASKYPMVKMHPALIWWRQHEGQEIKAGNNSGYYEIETFLLYKNILESNSSPLNESERKMALQKLKQHHARHILRMALLKGQFRATYSLYKKTNINLSELLTGLRPYVYYHSS